MKTRIAFLLTLTLIILLTSCNGLNILGKKVELVNNRNPDGTFKPVNQVTDAAGEVPDSNAMLFHYPSGTIGVSLYTGAIGGTAPKLSHK